VNAGPQNYDKETQSYNLVFNNPGYKLGEKYQILLSKKDSIIKNLTLDVTYFKGEEMIQETTTLGLNNYFVFTIRGTEYFEGKNDDKLVKGLDPSPKLPLEGVLTTDRTKTGFVMLNESGQPLKGAKLTIDMTEKKSTITATSDKKGVVWVDSKSLSTKFRISAEGRDVVGENDGVLALVKDAAISDASQQNALTYVIKFKNKEVVAPEVASIVSLKMSTPANTDLSSYWAVANLNLTDSKGKQLNYTLGLNDKVIGGIPNGTYKVKATGKYANVASSSSTLTVKNGKGNLSLTLKPKFILEVDKDNKDYSFTVLNVANVATKKYTGNKPTVFGVTPGESYMIKDNSGGDIYTVAIDADSTVTRLVLGTGVVFGGSATIPHTGDGIMFLVALFFAALLGAVVSLLISNNKIKLKGLTTKAVSILLIGALLGGLLPQNLPTASAATNDVLPIGSGTPGSIGNVKNSPTGAVQTDPYVSVLMMGIMNGSATSSGKTYTLDGNADKTDMAAPFKFAEIRQKNMFYMASNAANYNIFKASTSSVLTFDSGYLKKIHGKTVLFPNTKQSAYGAKGTMQQRLLDLPERAKKSTNGFEVFMGYATAYLNEGNATNRQIWKGKGSVSLRNMGDSLSREYLEWLKLNLDSGDEYLMIDGFLNTTSILDGYMQLLRESGETELADDLTTALGQHLGSEDSLGNYLILTQVVQGFYVKGAKSRGYAFAPMHEAVEWYVHGRKKESPSKFANANVNHEQKMVYGIPGDRGGAANSKWNKSTPSFTYVGNVRDTSAIAIKPQTVKVPIVKPTTSMANINKNPFAGWGYMPLGFTGSRSNGLPAIDAELRVKVLNANGQPTGEVITQPVSGWTNEQKLLGDVDSANSAIRGNMEFKHKDGRFFTIKSNPKSKLTLFDKKEPSDNLLNVDKAVDGTVSLPSISNPDSWIVEFGYEIPFGNDLDAYLGGGNGKSLVKSKHPKGVFSHAKLIIDVEAIAESAGAPVAATHNVPEWRMSKYFPDLGDGKHDKAFFDVAVPTGEGDHQKLTPSGKLKFSLIGPSLEGASWAYSKPKLFNDDTETKQIDLGSTTASWSLAGDLLAVKDMSISKVKLASWYNNFSLFDGKIGASSKGVEGSKPLVKKTHSFVYGVKSPSDKFIFSETRYKYTSAKYDKWGFIISDGYYTPYNYSADAKASYNNAQYNTTVTFDNYSPKNVKTNKTFADVSKPSNGSYWETKQSTEALNVNPEVLMAYDDEKGNTSVVYAAGEKIKAIQPVNYNVVQYVNVDIAPTVTGMSVATDANAKKLAASLGSPTMGVIYKGAATTTNFEVAGEVELKTFAVDIGNTALKNSWNPTSTYSTDKVNNDFLARHGKKLANGKWEVTLETDSKMKVNGIEYGGKKSSVKATQTDETIIEHTLVVQGGKLVSVGGDRNLGKLSKELKEALTRMKISTTDNVFANFERNSGDSLTANDAIVATLGNAVRGSNDLAVNRGWYNEDISTLVVREYTNTFKLPVVMVVDKVPMQIPGLETPIDKAQFFSKGHLGYSVLRFNLVNAPMTYDSSDSDTFGGSMEEQFIVPNVSVLDTFN
jgi:hypothetical protein